MTLAIALAGLVLGVVSLSWQVWSWSRSGPGVRVTCENSLPLYDHPDGRQQPGEWVLTVKAANHGRASATVTGWGFELPDKRGTIVLPRDMNWSTPLPHRLEPQAVGSWHVEQSEIRRQAAELGVAFDEIKAFVTLATGKRVKSRKGVPLTSD